MKTQRIKRTIMKTTKNVEETRTVMLTIASRFASYLKHKERGRKDKRAIASANMILRMFLHFIESFHLSLAKQVDGATISIGGEEKKMKIINNMSTATLITGPTEIICQGTEDATKWNECLSPASFALMHYYLFDEKTRIKLNLEKPTEMGKLFSRIAVAGNFIMAMKEIQIGPGVLINNKTRYHRTTWESNYRKYPLRHGMMK